MKAKGAFWFRKTINGNIIGEFLNDQTKTIQTESGDLKNPTAVSNISDFTGQYLSSWDESNGVHCADLEIKPSGTIAMGFSLEWKVKGINSIYNGEAMLIEKDLLVGNFHQLI